MSCLISIKSGWNSQGYLMVVIISLIITFRWIFNLFKKTFLLAPSYSLDY